MCYDDTSATFRYLSKIIYRSLYEEIQKSKAGAAGSCIKPIPRFRGENDRTISLRLDEHHRKIINKLTKILGYETDAMTVRFIIHYGYLFLQSLVKKNNHLVLEANVYNIGRQTFLDMTKNDDVKMAEYLSDFTEVVRPEIIASIISNYHSGGIKKSRT